MYQAYHHMCIIYHNYTYDVRNYFTIMFLFI